MAKPRRRNKGDGSVYHHGDHWRATIELPKTADGKRRRKSVRAATKKQAELKRAELVRRFGGVRNLDALSSVEEIGQRWILDDVAPNLSPATLASYSGYLKKYIGPALGKMAIREVDPGHVNQLLNHAPAGSATRQQLYTTGRILFEFSRRLGCLEVNPFDAVRRPRVERDEVEPFNADEVAKIVAGTRRLLADSLLVRLALAHGFRQGELFGLKWDRVDLDSGSILIDQQAVLVDSVVIFKRPKSRASIRSVKLAAQFVAELKRWRAMSAALGPSDPEGLVFRAPRGGVLRRDNFRKFFWKPLLKSQAIKYRSFHNTRHTAITRMLLAGVAPIQVAGIAGHASADVTLKQYGHFMSDQQGHAVQSVESLPNPEDFT